LANLFAGKSYSFKGTLASLRCYKYPFSSGNKIRRAFPFN
jgi:hypothetical protein